MSDPILQTIGLSKRFGVKQALDDVTIALERGKIIGLRGPARARC